MKLTVDNMTLERGGEPIVSGIGFELAAGEALVITGENGSGKSTALRGMAGLLPLASGSVKLTDETGKPFEGPVREYCHYLGHQNAMKSGLTVHDNLDFWRRFNGHPHLAVEEALEEVDLLHTADLPFHYLSAGQKRRVAIARLLVSDRPVWILDEPTSGLDAPSVATFTGLVKAFAESGGILVAATHLDLGINATRRLEFAA